MLYSLIVVVIALSGAVFLWAGMKSSAQVSSARPGDGVKHLALFFLLGGWAFTLLVVLSFSRYGWSFDLSGMSVLEALLVAPGLFLFPGVLWVLCVPLFYAFHYRARAV